MKRLFIDTNVMLDLLAHRQPFHNEALQIFSLIDIGEYDGIVAPISFSTASFVFREKLDYDELSKILRDFVSIIEISDIDSSIVMKSIDKVSPFSDIEDAIQHYSALKSNCDFIITRNSKDFRNSQIPVYTPTEFLQNFHN